MSLVIFMNGFSKREKKIIIIHTKRQQIHFKKSNF